MGGDWLAAWIVLSAAVSNIGLYLAEMSSDAFQLMGMAELGMLPAALGRKSAHDTPTRAIVLATAAIVVMSLVSTFQEIVTTTNFLYRCVWVPSVGRSVAVGVSVCVHARVCAGSLAPSSH